MVGTLLDEEKEAGTYEVEFDARICGKGPVKIPEGIYFCTLQAGDYSATKKMSLLNTSLV
jgi:hypothetical protein